LIRLLGRIHIQEGEFGTDLNWNKEREKEIRFFADRCCCIYVTTTPAQSVWCSFSPWIEIKKRGKEKRLKIM
jgi:hypothetical protein